MGYEFKLPDLGEGLTEGEVARWLVAEGDEVAEDQPLVEIQTDKTTVEIPSPAGGKGAQARVEEEAAGGGEEGGGGRGEPLRGVRRLIAEHMARAHKEVPAVTWVEECDFSGVDLKLLVPTVLKAAAETLKDSPELNARLEGDEIVYLHPYDLGVAIQTDDGLVVPVVRGCDTASIEQLADEVKRLAEAARVGALKPEELRGSTFTVTSAGKLAGLLQTPIVNHPAVRA